MNHWIICPRELKIQAAKCRLFINLEATFIKLKSRIKGIIAREKKIAPKTNGFLLLIKGIFKGIKSRMELKKMALTKNSTFSSENDMHMCSLYPKPILDLVLSEINPKSVLDVGCGTGVSLDYFLQNRVDCIGIENSRVAIGLSKNPDKIHKYNLNREVNLKKKFDLVWSFEVIEHIHPDYEANFLKTLINHSDLIILSAARPGQGGLGHFNEQPKEYWINKFHKLGYNYDGIFSNKLIEAKTMHSENMMCFAKTLK